MKMTPILKLIPITFVAAGLFLGCGEAHDHGDGGDGHDHGDGGDGHDHGDGGGTPSGGVAVSDDYPLKTCLVSDEGLTSMQDEAFVHVHKGVTVKFCCEGCLDEFNEEPKKFLAKLEAAKKGELPKPAPEVEEKPEAKEGQPAPEETEGEKK
jgi:YHS domain-containing protein